MHQLTHQLRNEIAATVRLSNPVWRALFEAPEAQHQVMLDTLKAGLRAGGADTRTMHAWGCVAPMVDEREAIARFVDLRGDRSLRTQLPDLASVDEAVTYAQQIYRLTGLQCAYLRFIVSRPPQWIPGFHPFAPSVAGQ